MICMNTRRSGLEKWVEALNSRFDDYKLIYSERASMEEVSK